MGMYQTVEDIEVPEDTEAGEAKPRLRTMAAVGLGLAALLGVTVMSLPSGDPAPAVDGTEVLAREAYRAALAEPSPALRRARLADFADVHPDSDRIPAVRAQLSALEAHEASAWAAVTDALYAPGARAERKLAALDDYEAVWGADVLGGRGGEIRALRAELTDVEGEPEPPPSRALEGGPSPIPESINAGRMAGGPVVVAPPPMRVIPPVQPTPAPRSTRVEIPPRVLRAPPPRYPRSAQRRGVEAVVMLSMDVDERGRVEDVRIVSVDAPRYGKDFARAARRAAKRTEFEPRMLDGRPVPTANVQKRYRFEL